jgi:hypothetical protein
VALSIDIKASNDFEKSVKATAAALEDLAKHEERVNSIAKKIGTTTMRVAAAQKHIADQAKAREKKEIEALKKKRDDEKKRTDAIGKTALAIGVVASAAVAAVAAVAGIGAEIAKAAFESAQAKREAGALLDAFTARRGPEAMKLIDGLASQLGLAFSDAREEFVRFRQAGMDNRTSAALIKMRADLMAVGLSAEAAEKEIAPVLAAGHDRFAQARALQELSRAYGGIGDGAKAAAYATTSLSAAQNKVKNAVDEKLADLWKEIGPSIGQAAHRLADFATKLLDSEEGKATIAGIADAFKSLASAVNDENLTTALNVLRATGVAIATVFDGVGTAIGWVASEFVDFISGVGDKIMSFLDFEGKLISVGASIVEGLITGIKSKFSAAMDVAKDLAASIAGPFAKALGIQSPSKLFADYGKNTVAGFEIGQKQEIGGGALPLQAAAVEAPAIPRGRDGAPGAAGQNASGGFSVTIENLVVQGGGNADEIARTVRQELQLLLQAMSLSKGFA